MRLTRHDVYSIAAALEHSTADVQNLVSAALPFPLGPGNCFYDPRSMFYFPLIHKVLMILYSVQVYTFAVAFTSKPCLHSPLTVSVFLIH